MARMLGVSTRAVQDMINAGCPVVDRGSPGQAAVMEVAAVLAWVRQRDRRSEDPRRSAASETALGARARNAAAQAELREYELAQLRGELIRVSDVLPIVREELASVRARLLQIPGRVAPSIAGGMTLQEIEEAIDEEIRDALTELTTDHRELQRST